MAAEGEEIVWDENFPTTSIGQNVEKGTKHTLAAKAGEDYKFIKWTKDGADFSTDETTVITADEKTEYVAVFMYDNGWDGEAVTDINDATVIGDVLVVILLYTLWRAVSPMKPKHGLLLPAGILLFAFAVEFLQRWGFCDKFHITNRLLRILIGTGFSVIDLLSYCIGIVPCIICELFLHYTISKQK
jgi:hypothetical protein